MGVNPDDRLGVVRLQLLGHRLELGSATDFLGRAAAAGQDLRRSGQGADVQPTIG